MSSYRICVTKKLAMVRVVAMEIAQAAVFIQKSVVVKNNLDVKKYARYNIIIYTNTKSTINN